MYNSFSKLAITFIEENIVVCLTTLLIMIFFLLKKKKSKKYKTKHEYNIQESKKIINKLNQFGYNGQKINYLKKINPFVFEELLLSAFEKKGFKIERNKRYTNDGGIDGTIFNNANQKIYIQAKRYNAYIKLSDIKEFGELIKQNSCKGFFIHTGKTGKESLLRAKELNIEIYSGDKLIELIKTK